MTPGPKDLVHTGQEKVQGTPDQSRFNTHRLDTKSYLTDLWVDLRL